MDALLTMRDSDVVKAQAVMAKPAGMGANTALEAAPWAALFIMACWVGMWELAL